MAPMTKPAITAILFGAMLFALGMFPGLIAALREGLENFRDHISKLVGRSTNAKPICVSLEISGCLSAGV